MLEEAKELQDELLRVRRLLHSNPELSFEEFETKKFLVEQLTELGFKVRDGFLPTAVVAELGEAPFIALRSDMDALPIQEQNASAYASRKPNVMHACGHDAHMACMLGAARLLALSSAKFKKGIRIIFEPGSESADRSGARELIDAGVLNGVEGILGFHVDSTLAAFDVSVVKDAGLQSTKLQISARPAGGDETIHQFGNLICKLKEALPGTCGRSALKRLQFSRIESAENLRLNLVLNAENADDMNKALSTLRAICDGAAPGIAWQVTDEGSGTADNSKISGQFLQSVAEEICSKEKLKLTTRRAWSKDFEVYGEHVSAAFFYLGTSCGPRSHHSSTFEIDERTLYLASAVMAKAALLAASS